MLQHLDPRELVDRVLSSPSHRAETALRRALATNFTAVEAESIVAAVTAGRTTTAEGTPLPVGLHRFEYHLRPYEHRHGSDSQTVTFWPDDIFAFVVDLAIAAGIEIDRLSRTAVPSLPVSERSVAHVLVAVAQVEGIYVETPKASTDTRAPRAFLVALAAALIGMATGDHDSVRSVWSGALSGVGAWLIELIADRYIAGSEPETDFLEDLVLRLLEERGPMSSRELRAETHIELKLLQRTLRGLLAKRLIQRNITYVKGKTYRYDLAER